MKTKVIMGASSGLGKSLTEFFAQKALEASKKLKEVLPVLETRLKPIFNNINQEITLYQFLEDLEQELPEEEKPKEIPITVN